MIKWLEEKLYHNKRYGDYPCEVLLNNALSFLAEGKTEEAVSEICHCLSKADGDFYKQNVDLLRKKGWLPFEPRNVR